MSGNRLVWNLLARLSGRRRAQVAMAFVLMILSGAAEALSLAAVMPFLWVLMNPQELWRWPIVQSLAPALGISQPADLLLPAAVLFGVSILIAGVIRLVNVWLGAHLSAAIGSDLSEDAFSRSLHQPYSVHLARNSSSLIASMTVQLDLTVLALSQFLQMISSAIILGALLTALLLVDWQVALLAGAMASVIYGVIVGLAKSALWRNSEQIAKASVARVKILQESLGAIRDLILDGSQRFFLRTYHGVDRPMRQRQAQNQFLSLYPRYAVEAVGMMAIVALAYGLVSRRGDANEVIPILGMLALAAQRLLPTVQLVYSAWTDIRSKSHAVQAVLEMLEQQQPDVAHDYEPLKIKKHICFEHVSFGYAASGPPVVQNLHFRIRKGERIGIVGTTGSGKSTTLDLLMGLLAPTAGRISIDGEDLHDPTCSARLFAWRAAISHVPQTVYLADSSFAENIAFGLEPEQIDMERVRNAARQAQIADFIESSPQGYRGLVGERGVRLSGGQRQRIGIARALYRRAQLLVFDEATNALDNSTEQAVVESIDSLGGELTVVIVAHRVTTLRNCDQIIELGAGEVRRVGTYRELIEPTVL
jgi:ABC-type multidrug transport system fused ATPase/permease subunit